MLSLRLVDHHALRMAKTPLSFGHSVCNMVYGFYGYTRSRLLNFTIADPF